MVDEPVAVITLKLAGFCIVLKPVPLVPEDPLDPEVPADPDDPLDPELPLDPEVPDEPDVPRVPLLPDVPDEPLAPRPITFTVTSSLVAGNQAVPLT